MSETKLTPLQEAILALPLPEWSKQDDLGGLLPSEVRCELRALLQQAADLAGKAQQGQDELVQALKACWDLGIDSTLVPMVRAALAKHEGAKP